jgi:chemotaxis methyl-accepting protein methylase
MTTPPWKVENLGPESRKAHSRRVREGFFDRYFGGVVLDIGYRGYEDIEVVPVLEDAIGIDLNYPGYDGERLPFEDGTVDTVYASHTLEHITDPHSAIREWFRVLRNGGYLVLAVPHQFLYEKRTVLPSRWNEDHKRFYTPARILAEVESALPPNSYRVRRLVDDDEGYDYTIPPTQHARGAYQIELVLEKIQEPAWSLEIPEHPLPQPTPHTADFEAKLEAVFTDLRSATSLLAFEQGQMASRLEAIASHLARTAGVKTAPAATISDYLREDVVPLSDVITTTRFFQNRTQLRTLLGSLSKREHGSHRILVAGTSRGCEAYSLAIEGSLLGLDLRITAIDIDPDNIAVALEGRYPLADFKDFDGSPLLAEDTAAFFLPDGDGLRIRPELLRQTPQFVIGDLFQHKGLYDAIVCNNVLVHFSDEEAVRALRWLGEQLLPNGILAIGGAPINVVAETLGGRSGLKPIETDLEAIWEDWKGDRQSWASDPGSYCGMPPVDRSLPDWKLRFCTLFCRIESRDEASTDPNILLGNAGQAIHEAAESSRHLAQSAKIVVDFLDDLMK